MMNADLARAAIKTMNTAIINAVYHGGDAGGPYFSDYEMIKASMRDVALMLTSLTGFPIYVVEGYDCSDSGDYIKTEPTYKGQEPIWPLLVLSGDHKKDS